MLYEKTKEKELSPGLFQNPTKEYRGAPFWAWNEKLDKRKLVREIHQFREMGMGGFHIHCRVGLDTEYLGEEFFECVRECEKEARREDLLCYLYDEDRWPSGSAGGIVTREKEYRTRFLVFSPLGFKERKEDSYMSAAKAVRSKDRIPLGYYRVELDEEGYLKDYERYEGEPEKEGERWEAFLETSGDTPWFNNQAYVNTLDEKAIQKFLEVTHEKYYEEFQEDFGETIRTIFTDEPQTTHKSMMRTPFDREQVIMPFTDDFDETFKKEYGYSILDRLPELFWEKRDFGNYQTRYYYQAHVTERFSRAFGDQIGKWCEEHGIGLTGHMLNEWTLHSQTLAVGECMRPLKNFALPGVDMLCDRREFSTLKQAQSVARQQGREGVMCEIYGVTGWDFDFRNHKLAGDWQAALGVTLRVPHLTWASMEGEAKRDYPASIGMQSPWYREYPAVENHFARLNTALTRGKARVRVGVIHPIESYWMRWGNKAQTSLMRQVLEENFSGIIKWLLFGLIDFDFISESLLTEEGVKETEGFSVGEMSYEAVLVPECHTLRSHTLKLLQAFRKRGGEVIFLGELPGFVDGVPGDEAKALAKSCTCIPFNRARLLETLAPYRDVDIDVFPLDGEDPTRMKHTESGNRANNLFYQLREDGEGKWLFICHVNRAVNEHIAYTEQWKIRVKGIYTPICYDTMTGEIFPLKADYRDGETLITHLSSLHGSLLLRLEKGKGEGGREEKAEFPGKVTYFPEPLAYSLEEENALILDQAEYAFDDGEWQEKEELLRIDNLFRERLGYPLRMEALAQPWVQEEERRPAHMLRLRFTVWSEVEKKRLFLGMEHPEQADMLLNGRIVPHEVSGWYVDECIKKVPLLRINPGKNTLEVRIPFGKKTNVEWMYLLGDFGVRVLGKEALLVERPKELRFGNIVHQDLAFYGGNLTYETEILTEEGELMVEVSHYRGALLKLFLDGEEKGNLFLAPYRMSLGRVSAGKHRVAFQVFGSRINTFGAVHNANAAETWYGPNLWRTTGNKWSYEYQLKGAGILTTPVYWIKK